MATVNFNVPDEVKDAFDAAIDRILERRRRAPAISENEFRAERQGGRT